MIHRSQWVTVVVLVVALIASVMARHLAGWVRGGIRHDELATAGTTGSTANISGMDSFALALMLGGLRGPLVMILWSSSETQKSEKDLTGFDTQVEWIRLLQPEFDSVHIFQVWNKAYNISVQMASLANKYTTIVDALDYAEKVDRQRPDNINILASIAQVYFDKLGNSQEKEYYRQRVRQDTQWRVERAATDDRAVRRTRLAPRLDEAGNLLEAYVTPTRQRPADLAADAPWNDGSELQYLSQYAPYHFGLSPFALAYDYYKRAQVLQATTHRRHTQLSQSVIDSRPALSLKNWAEDEWFRGRKLEAGILQVRVLSEAEQQAGDPYGYGHGIVLDSRAQIELLTINAPLDGTVKVTPEQLAEMRDAYTLAGRLANDAVAEYQRHMGDRGLEINFSVYASHIDHLKTAAHLMHADEAYIRLLADPDLPDRQAVAKLAYDEYELAATEAGYVALRYFTADELLMAIGGYRDADIRGLSIERKVQVLAAVNAAPQLDGNAEDRHEYERYLQRALVRQKLLEAAFPELKS